LVDVEFFGTETQIDFGVNVFVERWVCKEREERGNTRSTCYKHCVLFAVGLLKEVAVGEFEPYFGAHFQQVFHFFGKTSLYGVGYFNGFVAGVALHGEATGLGPLAGAVIIFVECNVQELTREKLVFTAQGLEFEGVDSLEWVGDGD